MTREVSVIIEGFQSGQEEAVVTSASGTYHLHEGKHFIRYEEIDFEGTGVTKNQIKITNDQMELTKKEKHITRLNFDFKNKTEAIVQTPYGGMIFEIVTKNMQIKEQEDNLRIDLEYAMYDHGNHLSDNRVSIQIIAKGKE